MKTFFFLTIFSFLLCSCSNRETVRVQAKVVKVERRYIHLNYGPDFGRTGFYDKYHFSVTSPKGLIGKTFSFLEKSSTPKKDSFSTNPYDEIVKKENLPNLFNKEGEL